MRKDEAFEFAHQVDDASFIEVIQFGEQDFGVFIGRAHGRLTGKAMVNGYIYMTTRKPYLANVRVVATMDVANTYGLLLEELKARMGRIIGGDSHVC